LKGLLEAMCDELPTPKKQNRRLDVMESKGKSLL
jgi:hypothetical protein